MIGRPQAFEKAAPDRQARSLSGDGGCWLPLGDLISVKIAVFNNGSLGSSNSR
jgi:thiamine pyrophosphate-dependent acetolactate synthase large subunit-like protein